MNINRRRFLQCGASASGLLTLGSLAGTLGILPARAANVNGYKAIVCLFMLGGLDGHDVVIPQDQGSYDAYADIRGPLLQRYASSNGASSRARSNLLPLSLLNSGNFGGRAFGLPTEMASLHRLFEAGDAAIIGNVGPLIEPVTRELILDGQPRLPKRLYSHNDQQSTWMSSNPEGAQVGWGGKIADAAVAAGANRTELFTAITTLGNELYLTGERVIPYQVGLDGAQPFNLLNDLSYRRGTPEGERIYQLMRAHFGAANFASSNLAERDVARLLAGTLSANELFNDSRESLQPLAAAFPRSFLGRQMRAIAETISLRNVFGASRQVFFAAIGGFDTHSDQAGSLPNLLGDIDAAIGAFHAAMGELGVARDVTLFTASEFGRTLTINDDGTDHGWGSHQFVVGGGVQGRRIYGSVPPPTLEHTQDDGGGRLIPELAVDQLAGSLAGWFGLTAPEISAALPNLSNFPAGALDLFGTGSA